MSVGKLTKYGMPFANVVTTGTATNSVTPGRTIESLKLKLGGTSLTKAMLTSIKIKANGKVIVEGTGTELQALNTYRGETANAAYLDIPFADYSLNNEVDRMLGAFDTSLGIGNITSEVVITGATAPTLSMILTESAQQKANGEVLPFAGLISKVLKYPFSVAVGGTMPFVVPFGPQMGQSSSASTFTQLWRLYDWLNRQARFDGGA